jgi:mono/diheme cytochrome c family protein
VRDGRVYMPKFKGILSQEALWAIRTYIESRHVDE